MASMCRKLHQIVKCSLEESTNLINTRNSFRQTVSVCARRTRGNGHKLKHKRLHLNIRKHFFTVRVTEHWHRLLREVGESPSLEIFKSRLDMVLGNVL